MSDYDKNIKPAGRKASPPLPIVDKRIYEWRKLVKSTAYVEGDKDVRTVYLKLVETNKWIQNYKKLSSKEQAKKFNDWTYKQNERDFYYSEFVKKSQSARQRLFDKAKELFSSAFIDRTADANAKRDWIDFVKVLNEFPLDDRIISSLISLSNIKIKDEDRKLLFSVMTQKAGDRTAVVSLLKKVAYYLKSSSLHYNGWQSSSYDNAEIAFLKAVNAYTKNDYERFLAASFKSVGFDLLIRDSRPRKGGVNLLTELNLTEAKRLIKIPVKEFYQRLDLTLIDSFRYPPGHPLKIRASRIMNDLSILALLRGISIEGYSFDRMFVKQFPGLTNDEYKVLYKLSKVMVSPEKTDNHYYRDSFVKILQYTMERYVKSAYGSKARISYATSLHYLYYLASHFGFSQSALDVLLNVTSLKFGKPLGVNNSVSTLKDLEKNPTATVGPFGLPKEVQDILRLSGKLELVQKNLREIIFRRSLREKFAIFLNEAQGLALSAVKTVLINPLEGNGKIMPAWKIALILVHEAAHAEWGRHEKVKVFFLGSTPNERQSNVNELEFLNKLLENGKSKLSAEDIKDIKQRIKDCTLAVRASNIVMGYDKYNMKPYQFIYPSKEFLLRRGLSKPKDLDVDNYSSHLPIMFVPERFDELVSKMNLSSAVRTNSMIFLRSILSGDLSIEGIIDDKQAQIFSVNRAGEKKRFTKDQALMLVQLMSAISKKAFKSYRKNPIFLLAIYSAGNSRLQSSAVWSKKQIQDVLKLTLRIPVEQRYKSHYIKLISRMRGLRFPAELDDNSLNDLFRLACKMASEPKFMTQIRKMRSRRMSPVARFLVNGALSLYSSLPSSMNRSHRFKLLSMLYENFYNIPKGWKFKNIHQFKFTALELLMLLKDFQSTLE